MIRYYVCIRKFNKYHKWQLYISFPIINKLRTFYYVVRWTLRSNSQQSVQSVYFFKSLSFSTEDIMMFLSSQPVMFLFFHFASNSSKVRQGRQILVFYSQALWIQTYHCFQRDEMRWSDPMIYSHNDFYLTISKCNLLIWNIDSWAFSIV